MACAFTTKVVLLQLSPPDGARYLGDMASKKAPAKKKTATAAKKTATKKTATKKTAGKKAAAKKAPAKTAASKSTKKAAATSTKKAAAASDPAVGAYIAHRFQALGGWRGALLAKVRAAVLAADPDILEERKWIKPSNPHGVPTYSHGGIVGTLEVYKDHVKFTFAYGSKVKDPTGMFNASLLGLRRAVDWTEDASFDAAAFQALVKAAVAVNLAK